LRVFSVACRPASLYRYQVILEWTSRILPSQAAIRSNLRVVTAGKTARTIDRVVRLDLHLLVVCFSFPLYSAVQVIRKARKLIPDIAGQCGRRLRVGVGKPMEMYSSKPACRMVFGVLIDVS
jgi:hypothetical protein